MSIFSIKDLFFHPKINLTKEFEDYSSEHQIYSIDVSTV
jgi:hypothetical protein